MKHMASGSRFIAVFVKECLQMRRDRLTFAMMIGIPIFQLILFGYAINTDPKHLPTAIFVQDNSVFSRSVLASVRQSGYFELLDDVRSERAIREALKRGDVQFVLHIPPNYSKKLVRGERPAILLESDGTDPSATANATAALRRMADDILDRDLKGPMGGLSDIEESTRVLVHNHFNEERMGELNIVPGLMGVVLTMTMVIITALAITREKERGTMEGLLASPVRPSEVILGKVLPYVLVGYLQSALILILSVTLFNVPWPSDFALLSGSLLIFIVANLGLGIMFSSIARNQLQAMQLSFFFFLPSILLSGFMFPFRGMPAWAQSFGELLPLTHFLRIVRGILLKQQDLTYIWPELLPIIGFSLVVLAVGIFRYRQTVA